MWYLPKSTPFIQAKASLVAQTIKHLPVMQKTWIQSLGREDTLEKGMATHSSILAWRIPWTEKPGRLQSMGSKRVRQDGATNTVQANFYSTFLDLMWYGWEIWLCMCGWVCLYSLPINATSKFSCFSLIPILKMPTLSKGIEYFISISIWSMKKLA